MEDIIDVINYFNKENAILVGHDWGALYVGPQQHITKKK